MENPAKRLDLKFIETDFMPFLDDLGHKMVEIQKELGHILDYGVFVSDGASSPNVWLTISYENMAAMEQTKEKYDAVNKVLEERYGDDEEELDKISKGYEEIRTMIDNQRINQVIFEM